MFLASCEFLLGRAGRERVCAEFSMEKSIAGLWSIIEGAIHNAAR